MSLDLKSTGRPVGSTSYRKIRKLGSDSFGDLYGITISRETALEFKDVVFRECISGCCIIFESGCR